MPGRPGRCRPRCPRARPLTTCRPLCFPVRVLYYLSLSIFLREGLPLLVEPGTAHGILFKIKIKIEYARRAAALRAQHARRRRQRNSGKMPNNMCFALLNDSRRGLSNRLLILAWAGVAITCVGGVSHAFALLPLCILVFHMRI